MIGFLIQGSLLVALLLKTVIVAKLVVEDPHPISRDVSLCTYLIEYLFHESVKIRTLTKLVNILLFARTRVLFHQLRMIHFQLIIKDVTFLDRRHILVSHVLSL